MNFAETATVLATIQFFDNRKVEEKHIIAWQEMLEPHTLQDCLAAVRDHYRHSDKWLMPSHIVEFAAGVERQRLNAVKAEIRLSDADSNRMLDGDFPDWREKILQFRRLVATGAITPAQAEMYIDGQASLESLIPKAITR